jgi:hypothetical protein
LPINLKRVQCRTFSGIKHYGTGYSEPDGVEVLVIAWGSNTYRSYNVEPQLIRVLGDREHEGGVKDLVTKWFCEARRKAGTHGNQADKNLPHDLQALQVADGNEAVSSSSSGPPPLLPSRTSTVPGVNHAHGNTGIVKKTGKTSVSKAKPTIIEIGVKNKSQQQKPDLAQLDAMAEKWLEDHLGTEQDPSALDRLLRNEAISNEDKNLGKLIMETSDWGESKSLRKCLQKAKDVINKKSDMPPAPPPPPPPHSPPGQWAPPIFPGLAHTPPPRAC